MKLHSSEKTILLAIVVCVLLISGGYSFAYFVSNGANVTGEGGSTNISTAKLINVKYDAGSSSISLANALPGVKSSKNFNITVTPIESQNTANYTIKLVINSNTFVKCTDANYNANSNACVKDSEELVYTLTDSEGGAFTGDITGKTGEIVLLNERKTTAVEEVYNYTLEVSYKNTGADQNHNFNKTLEALLKVEPTKEN